MGPRIGMRPKAPHWIEGTGLHLGIAFGGMGGLDESHSRQPGKSSGNLGARISVNCLLIGIRSMEWLLTFLLICVLCALLRMLLRKGLAR